MTENVQVSTEPFGTLSSGDVVTRYCLVNRAGASVSIIDYGAIITSLVVPDRAGQLDEVTVGYGELSGYLSDPYFLGAVVGRYANRIARGQFELDGHKYQLPQNDGTNHLHGGPAGFYRALWKSRSFADASGAGVELTLHSPDGDAGYPGALDVWVRYHFDDECCLTVNYEARTTKPTVLNLTQHSYFNLEGGGSILDHELQIRAAHYTPTDSQAIPTGIAAVAGTALDFRSFHRIGERIDAPEPQLQMAGGYDHNYVIDGDAGQLRLAAELRSGKGGRCLRILTTEPGMQLYTGNFLPKDGSVARGAKTYGYREGLCLETQHFPDAPNQPRFPSTRLDPGQIFRTTTKFAFRVT